MNTQDEQPKPLINHRWQLPCLEQMIDDMLPEWPQGKHPDFSTSDGHARLKNAFRRFGENLLRQLSISLEKAAGRGISEALALIQDPAYHKTVQRRTKREIQRDKEYQERQRQERERWKRCELTEEERKREIGRITNDIQYHTKQIEELQARKLKVETSNPVLAEAKTDGNDDFWDDTILFD